MRSTGTRHPLLFFRRSMDGVWQTCLLIGIIFIAIQQFDGRSFPYLGNLPTLPLLLDELLLIGGILLVFFAVLVLVGRRSAYAQACSDHLRISTPITRIKISYRRIRSIHPTNIAQLYPTEKLNGSSRSFLEPFLGKTAVVIGLKSYPHSMATMRFFLGKYSLLPSGTGLVLMVPDWMALSTELDTMYGNWRYT